LHVEAPLKIPEPVQSPGAARFRLRDATAPDHAAVDRVYAGFDLSSPQDYRAFLEAQHSCLAPLEEGLTASDVGTLLPDWPARRRTALLVEDLDALGAPHVRPMTLTLALPGPAAILGAVYVLEGSRFGGAVLARRLPFGTPARFLGAPAEPRSWRTLVEMLDRHLDGEARMDAAIAAARAVFDAFTAAGRQRLGAAHGR
jgi:heme oxygenase